MGTPVIQYDLNGNFIKQWPSVYKAALELDLRSNNMYECCNHGRYKSVGGFRWKYAREKCCEQDKAGLGKGIS